MDYDTENTKSYELMIDFIKTKAEKYKALDNRNNYVESRIYDGYDPTLEEQKRVTEDFNNCSEECLEREYRLINFLSKLKLSDLNSFYSMVKHYSKNRESEMKELSVYLLPNYVNEKFCKEIEYFEKYERPSIKDLLYMIARQKGKIFGMNNEEALKYASHEMENLIDIDVLTLDLDEIHEMEKQRIRKIKK